MAALGVHGQHAFLSLPHAHSLPPTCPVIPRPDDKRGAVETPHDDMLQCGQESLPPAGSHHGQLWSHWSAVDVARFQLHRLRRAIVHRASLG